LPLASTRAFSPHRLHDEGIEAVQAYLQQVWGDAAARFKLLADN
jgi:hypothetical protein